VTPDAPAIRRALAQLEGVDALDAVMARGTAAVTEHLGFDRAMLARVEAAELVAQALHAPRNPGMAERILAFGATNRPQLDHLLVETEMVRRGRAILVDDVDTNPRVHRGFIEISGTPGYVAAPIMPAGRVIGFVHADHVDKGVAPTAADRDRLWAFAEGFGFAIERAVVLARLRRQQDEMRRLLEATEAVMTQVRDAETELLVADGELEAGGAGAILVPPEPPAALLTRREAQVLALLAQGATNAQIGERLVISAGTVKSHVRHILRKLGAANRAEAVSRWLRSDAGRAA
jgi:DNA-binding CsgD family transcriptional regulator